MHQFYLKYSIKTTITFTASCSFAECTLHLCHDAYSKNFTSSILIIACNKTCLRMLGRMVYIFHGENWCLENDATTCFIVRLLFKYFVYIYFWDAILQNHNGHHFPLKSHFFEVLKCDIRKTCRKSSIERQVYFTSLCFFTFNFIHRR